MRKLLKNLKLLFVFFLIFSLVADFFPDFDWLTQVFENSGFVFATSGDVILLWDTASGTVPDGWSCISCSGGQAFYGVFPVAASSYGGSTAGADTHSSHTISYSTQSSSNPSGTGLETSGSPRRSVVNSHAHTWGSPSEGSGDVKPPFKNLNFIYKNNPTTIPAGVIAIFATSTLPSGWSRYSAMDSKYLRGYSDNATGGATTHSHTLGSVTSGSYANDLTDSANNVNGTNAHSHTINASSTAAANNQPSYVSVVFAYNSSGGDSVIPPGLIAFFDASPGVGWEMISSGSPWNGNFLYGSTSFGSTGGSSADHNHGGSVVLLTQSAGSTLSVSNTAGANLVAAPSHTHNVTYTITNVASLPVYRNVILAKRITYSQSAFKFFENTDSTAVGGQLAGTDSPASLSSASQAFRLRMLLHISGSTLATNTQLFNLQYVGKGLGSCASPSGGTPSSYIDVSTSTLIAFYNNATSTATDGAALTASSTDPLHSTHSVVNQSYEEANTFTNLQSNILEEQDGKWDFALYDNSAPANTAYCFRAVKSDGSVIDGYGVYPQITTVNASVSCSTSTSTSTFGSILPTSIYTSTSNVTITSSCSYGSGCTLSLSDSGSGSNPGLWKSAATTYLIASADATLVAGTDGYGVQAATTSAGSGAVFSVNNKYLKTGNDVGGLLRTTTQLASTTSTYSSRELTITHKAAIGYLPLSGSYSDTITYSCVGN